MILIKSEIEKEYEKNPMFNVFDIADKPLIIARI